MNAELLANPYTAVAVALAALTAGVVTYAATHKSAADEIRKSHEEAIKAIDDTATSEMAQAETAMHLKNRLYELESQINSGTLADEDATKAKEEFSGAADQLNSIIPGIISNLYDETGAINVQTSSVNALTNSYYQLAKAKAMAAAYQAKIEQTAKDLVDINEKLKPYEDGSKSKTVDLHGTYGGKTYTTSLPELEYTKLTKEQVKLNDEMKGYISELAQYQQEATANTTKVVQSGVKKQTGAVKSGNAAKTASTKSAAQKQKEIIEEQYEKELRDLQFARDMEQITEAEYYKNLAVYRDKYFSEGSKEWQQYTTEIYKYQKGLYEKSLSDAKEALDESKKDLQKRINDISSIQQGIAETLKGHNALYLENSITGADVRGNDETITYTVLADLSKQTAELNKYADNIEAIKRRGVIPQSFIDEIRSLSVSEGLKFTDVLLGVSDEKFNCALPAKIDTK